MNRFVLCLVTVSWLAHAAAPAGEKPGAEEKKGAEVASSPRPAEVVAELASGNARFEAGVIKQRDVLATRKALTGGQHPQAIVLSCSDSRVPPELVFDETVGDLFVVRTAGNVADGLALASLEYAAEHLHSPVLVVLGHEKCGAVTAAASGAKMESPSLQLLVDEIAPGLAPLRPKLQGAELVHQGVEANVQAVAYEVVERSAILRRLVEEGHLVIVQAIYDLDTGHVRWLEAGPSPVVAVPAAEPVAKPEVKAEAKPEVKAPVRAQPKPQPPPPLKKPAEGEGGASFRRHTTE